MSITALPPPKEGVEKTSVEPEVTSLNYRGQQGKEASVLQQKHWQSMPQVLSYKETEEENINWR